MNNDRMLRIGSFAAVLYVVYLANEMSEFAITPIFWAVALVWATLNIKLVALVIPMLIGMLASSAYALGDAVGASLDVSLIYFPQILTMTVGSAWVFAIMRGETRFSLSDETHKWLHRFFIIGSLVWAIASIQTLSAGIIADKREVTGFSYLTTSDMFAIFTLSSLSRRKISAIEFFAVLVVGLLTVVLLGSRSAMLLLAVVSFIIFIRRFGLKSKLLFFSFGFPSALYAITEYVDFSSPAFQRLQTLVSLGEDDSLSDRRSLFGDFFEKLDSNPTCYIVSCHSPEGEYAHNFLSIVEHFGVIGAALFSLVFFAVLINWRMVCRADFFPLLLFVSVSMIFTRAWVSPVFLFYLGISLIAAVQGVKIAMRPKQISALHVRSIPHLSSR